VSPLLVQDEGFCVVSSVSVGRHHGAWDRGKVRESVVAQNMETPAMFFDVQKIVFRLNLLGVLVWLDALYGA